MSDGNDPSVPVEASVIDSPPIASASRVFIGGGSEAGAWAHELVRRGAAEGALIVSDQPPGAAPYDRHRACTRDLLDPSNEKGRTFDGLPLCSYVVSEFNAHSCG